MADIYDSWGNTISIQNGNGQELTGPNDIANLNPFRYRGYYLDSETGLYYLHNRYYDPQTCRFLNADTTDILAAKGDLYDKNLFAYCDNNPVARVDYGGEFWVQVGATFGGFLLSGSLEERKQFQTYASEPVRMMKYADREDISGQSRKEYEAIEAIYRQWRKCKGGYQPPAKLLRPYGIPTGRGQVQRSPATKSGNEGQNTFILLSYTLFLFL